jgi:NADP-dependent 3-hydroxy acid dehydrogenase YdfG
MIDVNLRGVLHGIAAALPVFRAQRSHPPLPTSGFPARPSTPPPSPRCAPCAR